MPDNFVDGSLSGIIILCYCGERGRLKIEMPQNIISHKTLYHRPLHLTKVYFRPNRFIVFWEKGGLLVRVQISLYLCTGYEAITYR